MIIDDNFLSNSDIDSIKNTFFDNRFPWHLFDSTNSPEKNISDLVTTNKTKETFQFTHLLRYENSIFSEYYDYVNNYIFVKFLEKNKIHSSKIIRAKLNLLTSLQEDVHQPAHTDVKYPHSVFLYYINDSDGDTIMFNEKYNGEKQELTENSRVSPKAGRAIYFDGLTYHASSAPKKYPYRAVINIAFLEGNK
jgi:hypothetical protein